jgi:hypothetical protein
MSEGDFRPRTGSPQDPAVPPTGIPGGAAFPDARDLRDQFDVIRRVLDARRDADYADPAGGADPIPVGTPPHERPALPKRSPRRGSRAQRRATPPAPPRPAAGPAQRPSSSWAPTATSSNGSNSSSNNGTGTGTGTGTEAGARAAGHRAAPAPVPAVSPSDYPAPRARFGRRAVLAVVAAAGVLIGAGFAVTAVSGSHGHSAGPPGAPGRPPSAAATPQTVRAVAWVLASVAPTNVVACDVSACALLRARGFPASSLITVLSGVPDVEQADVVVLSPVVRAQLGTRADAVVADAPLAAFGSGAGEVDVSVVALDGSAAYARGLAADRISRRLAGAALLGNRRLIVSPQAAAQLAAGLVDTRVCTLLAVLLATHRLVLAGFTPAAPGAGPDQPLTGFVVAAVDGEPTTARSPDVAALTATVRAQQAPYLAMSVGPAPAGGALRGLRIAFSEPEPPGLLPGTAP